MKLTIITFNESPILCELLKKKMTCPNEKLGRRMCRYYEDNTGRKCTSEDLNMLLYSNSRTPRCTLRGKVDFARIVPIFLMTTRNETDIFISTNLFGIFFFEHRYYCMTVSFLFSLINSNGTTWVRHLISAADVYKLIKKINNCKSPMILSIAKSTGLFLVTNKLAFKTYFGIKASNS